MVIKNLGECWLENFYRLVETSKLESRKSKDKIDQNTNQPKGENGISTKEGVVDQIDQDVVSAKI